MKQKPQISLYWKCQVAGWSAAALYWAYTGLSGLHFQWGLGLVQFVTDIILYISLTHLYRNFALRRRWQQLALKPLLQRMIAVVLVMGIAYTVVTLGKIWLSRLLFAFGPDETFVSFINNNWVGVLMGGIRLMSIWLLAYHLYHYAQREIIVAKENARLAEITRDARIQNLATQLNPHFLFNALNTIKAMVIDEPLSARRGVDLLSDLLRNSLYDGEDTLVLLSGELTMVKDYLELEQLRFDERLAYQLIVDPGMEQVMVPRLSVQTLVENAVKHGISRLKNGGEVVIQINRKEDKTVIRVTNQGTLEPVDGQGLGLKNLLERLALIYDGSASFEIKQSGVMVDAIMEFPVTVHQPTL